MVLPHPSYFRCQNQIITINSMEISRDTQEEMDLQWFAIDNDGNIGSFWSGGCQIPKSAASDEVENARAVAFFMQLPFRTVGI